MECRRSPSRTPAGYRTRADTSSRSRARPPRRPTPGPTDDPGPRTSDRDHSPTVRSDASATSRHRLQSRSTRRAAPRTSSRCSTDASRDRRRDTRPHRTAFLLPGAVLLERAAVHLQVGREVLRRRRRPEAFVAARVGPAVKRIQACRVERLPQRRRAVVERDTSLAREERHGSVFGRECARAANYRELGLKAGCPAENGHSILAGTIRCRRGDRRVDLECGRGGGIGCAGDREDDPAARHAQQRRCLQFDRRVSSTYTAEPSGKRSSARPRSVRKRSPATSGMLATADSF